MCLIQGKVCVITGANAGIGRAAALALAHHGARVVLICRDSGRGEEALAAIRSESGNNAVELLVADLAVQAEVRRLADVIAVRYPTIDVLWNNAGLQRMERTLTPDGLEQTFAVNHLAPFLLTNLLLDPLRAAAPARVITTASVVHRWGQIDFADLQSARSYSSNRAYYQSKLANVLFTAELARRLDPSKVTANSFAPGMVRTAFARDFRGFYRVMAALWLGLFGKSPAQGAATGVMLACDPALAGVTGGYFANSRRAAMSPAAQDPTLARRLWDVSAELVGLPATVARPGVAV